MRQRANEVRIRWKAPKGVVCMVIHNKLVWCFAVWTGISSRCIDTRVRPLSFSPAFYTTETEAMKATVEISSLLLRNMVKADSTIGHIANLQYHDTILTIAVELGCASCKLQSHGRRTNQFAVI